MKNCVNCKNCIYEHTEPCECKQYDNMTEEETEMFWTNSKEDCPYWEQDVNN